MRTEFIPSDREWVHSHYYSVTDQIAHFCGDIHDTDVLDVGCGEMLSDFGLLRLGIRHMTGLELYGRQRIDFPGVADRLARHKIFVPDDYASRLRFVEYDGRKFPFPDESFDVIVSWSAFEHVTDVPQVLREIKRVARGNARIFIQVCPWYHCLQGSHLSDYIKEPYFHLTRSPEWVREMLSAYVTSRPEQHDFILGYMWGEFQALNKYSANQFYADVIAAGFKVQRAVAVTYEQDLTAAPRDVPFSDLMIYETKMLLRP